MGPFAPPFYSTFSKPSDAVARYHGGCCLLGSGHGGRPRAPTRPQPCATAAAGTGHEDSGSACAPVRALVVPVCCERGLYLKNSTVLRRSMLGRGSANLLNFHALYRNPPLRMYVRESGRACKSCMNVVEALPPGASKFNTKHKSTPPRPRPPPWQLPWRERGMSKSTRRPPHSPRCRSSPLLLLHRRLPRHPTCRRRLPRLLIRRFSSARHRRRLPPGDATLLFTVDRGISGSKNETALEVYVLYTLAAMLWPTPRPSADNTMVHINK